MREILRTAAARDKNVAHHTSGEQGLEDRLTGRRLSECRLMGADYTEG